MGYIGKTPTSVPLTSSDVADGIISNAKLAQDIISADTALGATPADTDEFLVSDAGTLKRMDYSHIKVSGGAWTKIKTITISADTDSVSFIHGTSDVVIDDTYQTYKILVNGLSGYDSTGWKFHMHIYDGGTDGTGTTLISSGSDFAYGTQWADSANNHGYYSGTSNAEIHFGNTPTSNNTAGSGWGGEITAYNTEMVAADNCYKMFTCVGWSVDSANLRSLTINAVGAWKSTTNKIRGFKFLPSASSWNAGEFILYGIT